MPTENEQDKLIPHQSVIVITADIMERLSNGKVTGLPIKKISGMYTIKGNSRNEVIDKSEQFLGEVKKLWEEKYMETPKGKNQ